jgi:hypothetical protein
LNDFTLGVHELDKAIKNSLMTEGLNNLIELVDHSKSDTTLGRFFVSAMRKDKDTEKVLVELEEVVKRVLRVGDQLLKYTIVSPDNKNEIQIKMDKLMGLIPEFKSISNVLMEGKNEDEAKKLLMSMIHAFEETSKGLEYDIFMKGLFFSPQEFVENNGTYECQDLFHYHD